MRGEHEARRDRLAFGDARVGVGEGEADELLAAVVALRLVEGDVEDREDAAVQAELLQLDDRRQRVAGLQQLDHLVEGARLRHVVEQRRHLLDRRARLRLDLEAELGREADGADDPHRVLAIARDRVADHSQQLLLGVLDAAVVVDDDLLHRVVVHRVDGEVAPRRVLDLRPPDVVAQDAALGVDDVALVDEVLARGLLVAAHLLGVGGGEHRAEGRDLDHFREAPVLAAATEDDVDDPEAPADDEGAPEQRLHLLGRGVGGDVEVLRAQADEQVAHRAADDVGLVAGVGERRDDLDGALVDERRVDAVLRLRHLDALAARHARRPRLPTCRGAWR